MVYPNRPSTKLQIVPWSSTKEWRETYEQAYSEDIKLQDKAYTQMCIWKARYSNLPLGVECTMGMLHVRLCDKQMESSTPTTSYTERDLQLLYSTAVMRFLNHLTVMSNSKDSMYKMAERNKIPDWLINLRHEAAHGNSVPALYLLRKAGDIILQWLQEHYWETEANVMVDVVRDPEKEKEHDRLKIMDMLELWVILKINYWAGLKTIDKISSEDVRKQAMGLAEEEGFGIKLSVETKKACSKVEQNENVVDEVPMEQEDNDEFTHKIKTAFEPLVRKLFVPLKARIYKKSRYGNCLIESLVSYKGFCPEIEIEKLSELQVLELMSLLGELWKEVLEGLQTQGLLHRLLHVLMSRDTQVPTAHLWLRLITQVISGQPPPHPPGTEAVCQLLAERLPYEVKPEVLLRKVNFHYVDHLRPLELKRPSSEEVEALQQLARRILDNPTKCTCNYLHSVLSFWEPPLSADTKDKLCALAHIYNGQQPNRRRPPQVFTLASLLDQGLTIDQLDVITSKGQDDHSVQDTSPWKLYSGDADWSRCALGALPW